MDKSKENYFKKEEEYVQRQECVKENESLSSVHG